MRDQKADDDAQRKIIALAFAMMNADDDTAAALEAVVTADLDTARHHLYIALVLITHLATTMFDDDPAVASTALMLLLERLVEVHSQP